MQVLHGNGIEVRANGSKLHLDPDRATPNAVVSHGHLDHLTPWAHMTHVTLDILKVRRPGGAGVGADYDESLTVGGLPVRLHDAGHVFGSAMVEVEHDGATLLYTGDFNPAPGLTCGRAEPRECDVLITESTYGEPKFNLPPKQLTLDNIEAWMLRRLAKGPVALGAYQLGRAQELIALANRAGETPVVSPDIAAITAVYNAHGHSLEYAAMGTEAARELAEGAPLYVVPRNYLRRDAAFAKRLLNEGGAGAYLSGWCHRYNYFNAYAIEAQYPLSDHASFGDLLDFVEACNPKVVYTHHGASERLAREVRGRLGVEAHALTS